jgi:hypothetical protein
LEIAMILLTRRAFLTASLGAASRLSASSSTKAHFAVIADTHIIDEFYKGPESNSSDSESIFKTKPRLEAVRAHLNTLKPKLDCIFVLGDYFYNYPSFDLDFFFQNRTRVDIAKEITDAPCRKYHAKPRTSYSAANSRLSRTTPRLTKVASLYV